MGLADQRLATRVVEELAVVGGRGKHHDVDVGRHPPQLELEALVPGDGEGADGHVQRRADGAFGDRVRHVEHEDPIHRSRQRV